MAFMAIAAVLMIPILSVVGLVYVLTTSTAYNCIYPSWEELEKRRKQKKHVPMYVDLDGLLWSSSKEYMDIGISAKSFSKVTSAGRSAARAVRRKAALARKKAMRLKRSAMRKARKLKAKAQRAQAWVRKKAAAARRSLARKAASARKRAALVRKQALKHGRRASAEVKKRAALAKAKARAAGKKARRFKKSARERALKFKRQAGRSTEASQKRAKPSLPTPSLPDPSPDIDMPPAALPPLPPREGEEMQPSVPTEPMPEFEQPLPSPPLTPRSPPTEEEEEFTEEEEEGKKPTISGGKPSRKEALHKAKKAWSDLLKPGESLDEEEYEPVCLFKIGKNRIENLLVEMCSRYDITAEYVRKNRNEAMYILDMTEEYEDLTPGQEDLLYLTKDAFISANRYAHCIDNTMGYHRMGSPTFKKRAENLISNDQAFWFSLIHTL